MINIGTVTIETERLILRPFTLLDADDMFNNWANSEVVTKYLTWKAHKTVEDSKAYINIIVDSYNLPYSFNWAICLKEDGKVYGSIACVEIDEKTQCIKTGYALSEKLWNKGYMTEAYKQVVSYFFEKVKALRVTASHDTNNPASGKVMAKAGLKKEGILLGAGYNNQGICDIAIYGLTSNEYFESKKEK